MNEHRPAWREPMVWLAAGIPLATLVAGLATLFIAIRSGATDTAPESVTRTAQAQVTDLSPDARAADLGLQAQLSILANGEITVSQFTPQAQATPSLRLLLIHPTAAANDVKVELVRTGNAWQGRAGFDRDLGWRVQLSGPRQDWRLVAKLSPQQHQTALLPAVASP